MRKSLLPQRRGFALLAVLWLLVALSAVGLELSLAARTRRLAAANRLEGSRARWAAEAGIAHARAHLERLLRAAEAREIMGGEASVADPWDEAGVVLPDSVVLEDAVYRMKLRDADALLNINRASEEDLRRFFLALRVDFGEADRLAESIMDWRDPDDLHRARGAEREYYLERGSRVLPRNGPLQDLSELQYVKGMTVGTYERALPHLTLIGTGRINLNSADREVLLALPGVTEQTVAVLLRQRREGRRVRSLSQLADDVPGGARQVLVNAMPELYARTTFETRELEILTEGGITSSPVRASVHGLFVRAGPQAFLVWSRAE